MTLTFALTFHADADADAEGIAIALLHLSAGALKMLCTAYSSISASCYSLYRTHKLDKQIKGCYTLNIQAPLDFLPCGAGTMCE